MTLAITILISAVVSLTLVPMMSARWLRHAPAPQPGDKGFSARTHHFFERVVARYDVWLIWVLKRQGLTLIVALSTMAILRAGEAPRSNSMSTRSASG